MAFNELTTPTSPKSKRGKRKAIAGPTRDAETMVPAAISLEMSGAPNPEPPRAAVPRQPALRRAVGETHTAAFGEPAKAGPAVPDAAPDTAATGPTDPHATAARAMDIANPVIGTSGKAVPSAAAPSAPPVESRQPAAGGSGEPPKTALPDWDRLAVNMGLWVEEAGKAASAMFKPRDQNPAQPAVSPEVTDMVKTLGQVATHWLSDPNRVIQAQAALSTQFIDLWANSLRRFSGTPAVEPAPVATPADRRFAAPEWRTNPIFDFLRQAYLMTTDWAASMVEDADSLDPQTRDKARFYLRQVSGALSPSNFLATNPELLRQTFEQSGENLVRGMRMLAEDIEAGQGELRIRQSDPTPFRLGVNMAVTPGKVVYRTDLMELIQYTPATEEVYRRPLLIVPPWINKFYVLDLNPEKSFIRWAVEQGLTVFVISWVNPDERHAGKDFESYMCEGILAALDAIELATGERDVSTVGYCVGGTLLAITLAYLAARGDRRISSSTFFTAQVDFRDAGDLKVFAGEEQIQALEAQMAEAGYLKGSKMANAFNMLRPNELIWSYVVDNYIRGKTPMAFDLLVWNADSTRMPAANHAFYLRNCYLGNKLTQGDMDIGGERLDLGKVTIPIYNLATREDHIAPARSVFTGAKFFGGPMRYVLAGSGHIAGVVNPPGRAKYQFWSGPEVEGTFEDWLKAAVETKGTWWPDWLAWLNAQAPAKVPARHPGTGRLKPLCDAPGEYVRTPA